jgi:hypothetical protein
MKLASARWTAVDGDQRAAAFAYYLLPIVENHRSDFLWSPMRQCGNMDTGPGESRIERRLVEETDGGGFG